LEIEIISAIIDGSRVRE